MSGGRAAASDAVRAVVETTWRTESRRVLATLIRLLGDFDRAEEALHDAFAAAVERWPVEGVPAHPRAWLVSAGRFRAIDAARRRARFDALEGRIAAEIEARAVPDAADDATVADDTLRLVFTCCHPALALEARAALTLREVCGLTTEAIARAFLVGAPTIAQRIVRAKTRIREMRIPYDLPAVPQLADRLEAVHQVLYLVFTEGYGAAPTDGAARAALCDEAIRLARALHALLPTSGTTGLLALLLLHGSRRRARIDDTGALVLLEEQDRARWDPAAIAEGCALAAEALRGRPVDAYAVQAAIAALHAEAPTPTATDWAQIVALYDVLHRIQPTPVVALNRAAAIAMRDGPAVGLALVDALGAEGALARYHPFHASRGELLRRLRHADASRAAFARAAELAPEGPERRHLLRRAASPD